MQIGDSASLRKAFGDGDVRAFAALSMDTNPVHLDEAYARETRFEKRIVHGALVGSLVSAVLGTQLPGPGCLYLSQTATFKKPVFLDETIEARVTVKSIDEKSGGKRIVVLTTVCQNERGETVVEGEATMMVFAPSSTA